TATADACARQGSGHACLCVESAQGHRRVRLSAPLSRVRQMAVSGGHLGRAIAGWPSFDLWVDLLACSVSVAVCKSPMPLGGALPARSHLPPPPPVRRETYPASCPASSDWQNGRGAVVGDSSLCPHTIRIRSCQTACTRRERSGLSRRLRRPFDARFPVGLQRKAPGRQRTG